MSGHLLLIDSSGFAYRAYHGTAPRMRSDGMPTHCITGFMSMLWSMLGRAESADPPTHAAAVFDAPGKTFRHRLSPDYKAGRTRPDGLSVQLPFLRDAARVLGIEAVELKGFEADDVIATLATMAKAAGVRTTVISVDKDLAQLIEDGVIEMVDPDKRVRVTAADVMTKFGVPPHLMNHMQALAGDAVDGIPGVPGVGPKTAAGLIRRFGDVHALVKALDNGTANITKAALRSALRHHRKDIPGYLKLTTLRRDVPLGIQLDTLRVRVADRSQIAAMLQKFEAADLLQTVFRLTEGKVMYRVVDPIKGDPLFWWKGEIARPGQKIPDDPQCGFYRRRLVRGGDYVAARIWRETNHDQDGGQRKENLLCEVNGERCDPLDQWGRLCTQPIAEAVYKKMIAEPPKSPSTAINWNEVEI